MPIGALQFSNGVRAVEQPLPRTEFLDGLAEPDQRVILDRATCQKIPAKETVIQGGAKATQLFLLQWGTARYFRITKKGDELLLRWLVPGDVFGLATVLKSPSAYMGSVQTTTDCTFYCWTHADLRRLSHTYPQLTENALRVALHYLSEYSNRHARLLTKTAEQRLACSLVNLGNSVGHTNPAGVQVDITNEQLGGLADVGLFTASRVLKKWERKGAITKARGRVFIQSPEGLLVD